MNNRINPFSKLYVLSLIAVAVPNVTHSQIPSHVRFSMGQVWGNDDLAPVTGETFQLAQSGLVPFMQIDIGAAVSRPRGLWNPAVYLGFSFYGAIESYKVKLPEYQTRFSANLFSLQFENVFPIIAHETAGYAIIGFGAGIGGGFLWGESNVRADPYFRAMPYYTGKDLEESAMTFSSFVIPMELFVQYKPGHRWNIDLGVQGTYTTTDKIDQWEGSSNFNDAIGSVFLRLGVAIDAASSPGVCSGFDFAAYDTIAIYPKEYPNRVIQGILYPGTYITHPHGAYRIGPEARRIEIGEEQEIKIFLQEDWPIVIHCGDRVVLSGNRRPENRGGQQIFRQKEDILFPYGNSKLPKEYTGRLITLAQFLKRAGKYKLFLQGFTSAKTKPGRTPEAELALCNNRVKAVYDFLVSNGIPKSNIDTQTLECLPFVGKDDIPNSTKWQKVEVTAINE